MSSPRTLTNKEIKSIHVALKALDGRSDGGKFVAYELDVQTRWDVAVNLSILQRHIDAIDSVTSAQLAANGLIDGEPVTDANHGRISKFTTELKEILARSVGVEGLANLEKDRLKKLPIPPSVISSLLPIIAGS